MQKSNGSKRLLTLHRVGQIVLSVIMWYELLQHNPALQFSEQKVTFVQDEQKVGVGKHRSLAYFYSMGSDILGAASRFASYLPFH